jgi:hypothetical protein
MGTRNWKPHKTRYIICSQYNGVIDCQPKLTTLQCTEAHTQMSDATFANQEGGKSMSSYVFLASRGAITWKSKRQTIIMLSTTESEYVSLSESGHKATWLRNLYGKPGFPQMKPTVIKGDNEGSISMTHDPQFHAQSKHIELQHHWVCDLINNNVLDIQNICDPEQTADILTKTLLKPKHQKHTREMGILPMDITR